MRIISDTEVTTHILPRLTLSSLLHSQALAFLSPTSQCPARISLSTPNYTQLFMPARTSTPSSVIKIVSVPSGANAVSGISGVNIVFDDETGKVSWTVGSSCLTALRTAGGSLMSSILVFGGSDKGEVRECVVFGDGMQSVFHVWLHLRYFAGLQRITVVVGSHRTVSPEQVEEKGAQFRSHLEDLCKTSPEATASWTMRCIPAQQQEEVKVALQSSQLIFTCTPSTQPLFPHEYLSDCKQRKHICAVGSYKPSMCELPADLVRSASEIRAGLMVDSIEACASEAGCLTQALGQERLKESCVELSKLLPPVEEEGHESDYLAKLERQASEFGGGGVAEEKGKGGIVSVFKSVGVGLQDVEVTKLVVRLAGDVGTEVAF
ncbi:hypothetical protein PHSY_003528 [Pseudozyma hubeiensis SY62]|uniref:Ornithine cyclodeaminase n=1 Tax=Pseudozyma hubeiensis (strain SY62) TaxID=1305764 RepID=R9PCZ8_PSEHS|nr:hypothetical protein PHSY_003528 [Pseudozyma hubeiensis SY62]GAC95950.1 hypothetical protein PHSY_003528 [Pseudozyma hubeiensis SY62]